MLLGDGEEKTFLLGVGCQKGGTTWLFDYLSKSPRSRMPILKELHIFDALDLEIGKSKLRKTIRGNKKTKPGKRNYEPIKLKSAMLADIDLYFSYFSELLSEPEALLTADITPTYAALSPERFRFIKEGFVRRGIRVKVIFLMRDPVERVWSSVRMRLRDEAKKDPDSPLLARGEEALLTKVYNNHNHLERTSYHNTINNLEQVFQPDELYYGFYELLFNDESTRAICGFLGIPHIEVDFTHRLNESPKSGGISQESSVLVANAYSDVYEFVENRFGAPFVESIWQSSRLIRR